MKMIAMLMRNENGVDPLHRLCLFRRESSRIGENFHTALLQHQTTMPEFCNSHTLYYNRETLFITTFLRAYRLTLSFCVPDFRGYREMAPACGVQRTGSLRGRLPPQAMS